MVKHFVPYSSAITSSVTFTFSFFQHLLVCYSSTHAQDVTVTYICSCAGCLNYLHLLCTVYTAGAHLCTVYANHSASCAIFQNSHVCPPLPIIRSISGAAFQNSHACPPLHIVRSFSGATLQNSHACLTLHIIRSFCDTIF